MGAMTDGITPLVDYATPTTVSGKIDALLAALPNPDTTSTSGAQQGIIGYLDEASPFAIAQLRVEVEALRDSLNGGDDVAFGVHTTTGAEATANLVDIETGIVGMTLNDCAVTVRRSGTNVTVDAVLSEPTDGTLRIADGSTYNTTAGDVIVWLAQK